MQLFAATKNTLTNFYYTSIKKIDTKAIQRAEETSVKTDGAHSGEVKVLTKRSSLAQRRFTNRNFEAR